MISKSHTRRALPASARLAALLLAALTLCALLAARPAQAAEWMQPYLEQVQEWGVMRGDGNGNLNEDRTITRAEFVTLVNRAFGYTEVGDNPFSDVNPNDWYAEDISIAHQAGYFNGTSASTASPLSPVTREQAAVLLGRCLRLQGTTGVSASTFNDIEDVGGWSRGLIQEAADLGIIQGYADGTFRPDVPITRGQMACFLVRALGTLIQEPGDQSSGGVYGNLTINVPGVKLKDTTITGNLYLTGGVGLGNLELENVTVLGKIIVCGSGEAEHGENSIILRNVTAGGLEVDSLMDQFLSIRAEGLTSIDNTTVRTSAFLEDLTEDGLGLKLIRLDGAAGTRLQLAGNIKEVLNLTPGSTLQLAQGVAGVVTMDEKAVGASLTIDVDSVIKELNLDTATPVTGAGSITKLNVSTAGSNVSMLPDTIYVRPGINSTVANQTMDNKLANESSEDPRILAGYPAARNIAPTSAEAVFRTNKAGTIRWALTALMDGSLGQEDLLNPSSNAKILQSGTINATASNTDFAARLTNLTREGSYYISALMEDARGHRSAVKVAAFTTPDDTVPAFATGYPGTPILTRDSYDETEQIAQIMVMATKSCQLYYVLLPKNSTAPTAADFRAAAIPGSLGSGVITLQKNTPFLISRINTSHLAEKTDYDLYLWLNDADNGKSSAVRKITVTTKDITAPSIVSLYSKTQAATSVTLAFSLSEPGTLSWAAVTKDASIQVNKTNPSLADQIRIEGIAVGGSVIRRGGPVTAAQGSTEYTFTVAGLQAETPYDLYYSFKDTAGNYGVYSESIEFPLPIKTLDTNNPSAELVFSHYRSGQNDTKYPWVDSDISVQFTELVRGAVDANAGDPIDFLALYNKVLSSTGAAKTQAKNDLGRALSERITLCLNLRATGGVDTPVTNNNGSLSAEQLANVDAWIDYREAKVTQTNGKTVVTFPAGTGHKLQSNAPYHFVLKGIEDTSGNPISDPGLSFTTASATVELANLDSVLSITVGGQTITNVRAFSAKAVGTGAVSADTRWDMIFWTSSTMRYDLYIRAQGATEWNLLGRVIPTPPGNTRVYKSVDANFKSQLLATKLVGSVENDADFPYLNQFTDGSVLEFAVAPVDGTYSSDVTLEVEVYAGTNTGINRLAQGDGQNTINSTANVSRISEQDGDHFYLEFDTPSQIPTVTVNKNGNPVIGSSFARIPLEVVGAGKVYYVAIPLNPVTMKGNRPTGDNYGIQENDPLLRGKKVNLDDVPVVGEDQFTCTLDEGNPNTFDIVTIDTSNPMFNPAPGTVVGNTGESLMNNTGTARPTLPIEDLDPETTYLLYLIPASKGNRPAAQAICYQFTTGQALPPRIGYDSSTSSSTLTIYLDPASILRYIFVESDEFGGTIFSQYFRDYVNPDKMYILEHNGYTLGNQTILEAMSTPADDPNDQRPVTNSLVRNSIFDLAAKDDFKKECYRVINGGVSNVNFHFDTVRDPQENATSGPVSNSGLISLSALKPNVFYTLLVVANVEDTEDYGFFAQGGFRYLVSSPIRVTDYSYSEKTRTLTVQFNKQPYYYSEGNGAVYHIDSCTLPFSHGGSTDPVNNYVPIIKPAPSLSTEYGSDWTLFSPTPNNAHATKDIGTVWRFKLHEDIDESGAPHLFFYNLCDENGTTKTGTNGIPIDLEVWLYSTETEDDELEWHADCTDAWKS